jgi:hypothetical protein
MIIKGRNGFFVEVSKLELIKAGFWICIGAILASSLFHLLLYIINSFVSSWQLGIKVIL